MKDTGGEPIIGANVIVKGTTIGTATDLDGSYTLVIPDSANTLQVSYIGMRDMEVSITGNRIDISMEEDISSLNEVVVVGYGTQRRRDLTGAVAVVDGTNLEKRNEMILSQALQGAAPGVSVTRSSGLPGATGTIRIRGITTIGDSNPLILVDGIPVESIDRINPSDVES
ncbi:MAG TPA: TonB-dependent receptor plug domain-containing protein, partial [Clostridiaceae bacterium]|nr:TonB-dependent receptor plug domain-containing protein [Clostridiaceae bacterium]